MVSKIRVMLVDDSAVVRGLFDRALRADGAIEVVISASNGQMAISMLRNTPVDVIVLDIDMPIMDGITALPELLVVAPKTRVIMASTLTKRNAEISVRAMELGASDYIAKPSTKDAGEVNEFYANLIAKIKALAPHVKTGAAAGKPAASRTQPANGVVARAPMSKDAPAAHVPPTRLFEPIPEPATPVRQLTRPNPTHALAIACSTGGPQALLSIFREFKGISLRAPIFITQHMPANFTAILADHITKASGFDCHEALDEEEVIPGKVYLAPGDYHMTIKKSGNQGRIALNQNPPENFCRPSADPMLRSLTKIYGDKLLVAVLTGLGADGARGASEVVEAGGTVIAQDEATCVVYGMPKAVVDAKLTSAIFPLHAIAPFMIRAIT
jgi:two-component system chemotaxis response regulator CheB